MGTSLTGLTPATTYDALIKVGDNGPLSATAKVLSDGLGNDSVLALSTARVGVGTTSPSYPLGIVGDTALEGNENYLYFHSTYSIGNNARARMRSVGAGGGSGYGGDFRIDTRASNNTWNADAFTINSAGNVGIGTSSPATTLQLDASGGATIRLQRTSASANRFDVGTDGSNMEFNVRDTGNFTFGGGNVGIGTSTPNQKLEVAGKIRATDDIQLWSANPTLVWESGRLRFYNNATATEVLNITNDNYLRLLSGTGGIQFNGDTAAANALDDYEEGTWTPVVRGSSNAGTYELSSAVATYTKIGRQVTVTAQISTAAVVTGGGSGYAQITGLPFTNSNQAIGATFVSSVNFSGSYLSVAFISSSGQSTIYFVETNDNSGVTDLPISVIGATQGFNFTLTYFV